MKHKPSEQQLTRIYAYAVRALEICPTLETKTLRKRIQSRYGTILTEKELFTLLNIES